MLDLVLRLPPSARRGSSPTRWTWTSPDWSSSGNCVGPRQLTLSDYAVIAQTLCRPLGDRPQPGGAAHQGPGRPGGGRSDGRGRGAAQHGRGPGVRHRARSSARPTGCWAVKQPGEGAWLYDAACALRDILIGAGHSHRRGQGQPLDGEPGLTPEGEASWSRLRRSW